ncbi:MAG TPA: DUF1588 domain-containing protein [Polyangiales bacterium]|nr:DUF1588 domain-containing protein [Polyangiales bacterium]
MTQLSHLRESFRFDRNGFGAALLASGVLLLAGACNAGQIGQPGGLRETSTETGAEGSAGSAAASNPGPPAAPSGELEPAPGTLRKLTVEQYDNSVRDLLGSYVQLPPDVQLEPDAARNGFYAVAASAATLSPAATEKLERAAYALAAQALSTAHRAELVSCKPAAVSDTACAESFLRSFGRRAFRRPLEAAELTRYVAIADNAAKTLGDFYQGLEFAVAGVLQSPNFLFRVELGAPDSNSRGRLRYTGYELATRLSYALWNTTPDDALLDAAQRGELDAGLEQQAKRLLEDQRALRALDNFHAERLGLMDLAGLNKDASLIGEISDDLRAALRDDVLRTFAELSSKPGQDLLEVFDSRVAYVNTQLSELYAQPMAASALTRIELTGDARLGFLGKPAFLALTAHNTETSPTLRGRYIRERILCESIAAPPANVVPVLGEIDPDAPTMRDRLRVHATDPSCAGCHNQMDPLGLALEHFDAVGRYRERDKGHALDTHGDLDGTAFDGAVELSELLRDDPRTAECVVRQAYRYTLGHVEERGEEPQIAQLTAEFERSGHDLLALFRSLSTSDAFRYAGKEQQ